MFNAIMKDPNGMDPSKTLIIMFNAIDKLIILIFICEQWKLYTIHSARFCVLKQLYNVLW